MNMLSKELPRTAAAAAPVAAPAAAAPSVLASRAMLASLNITLLQVTKIDRKASQDACDANGADSKAGRFIKELISKESMGPITKAASAARSSQYELTLPWLNNGARILSAAMHDKYSVRMAQHRAEFESAVRAFLPEYRAAIAEAQTRLGAMFNAAEYPSETEVAARFNFGVALLPVPTAADFRVDLADSQADVIRAQIEQTTKAAFAAASRDVWERVAEAVGHMAEKLAAYKPGSDEFRGKAGFRDSLVENVRDLVAILPGLNVTADPALDAIAARMAALCQHDAKVLKVSEPLRKDVQREAAAILADVEAFMA